MQTMKANVFRGPNKIGIEEVPRPSAGVGEAVIRITLTTICGVDDLDFAIIDFEHGPHGMTLLSAISALREDMPVIVITRDDERHVEELAYANGATLCFSKQAVATQLANAIRELSKARSEQVFA